MAIAAFLLGWGGLCVHCQTAALLEGSGLPLAPYLRAKALQGAISAGLVWLVLGLFPAWMPVSTGAGRVETQPPSRSSPARWPWLQSFCCQKELEKDRQSGYNHGKEIFRPGRRGGTSYAVSKRD